MADFDAEFAGALGDLVAPCADAAAGRGVEAIYVYVGMTAVVWDYNFFYRTAQGVKSALTILDDKELCFRLLDSGMDVVRRIRRLCADNGRPIPTEIRIVCEVKGDSFDADVEYDTDPFETPEGEYRDPVMDWFHDEKAEWAAAHPDTPARG